MAGRKNGDRFIAGGDGVPMFCWLAPDKIPAQLDLRRCGWKLSDCKQPAEGCIGVFHAADQESAGWMDALAQIRREVRRRVLVVGAELDHERAELLHGGFGDAVSGEITLEELGARARRVGESSRWLLRHREIGPLKLDLLAREAFASDRPLNLNPREFALLWRLADSLGESVNKQSLIQDVWRMGFVPATNSIAVHMSRLRRKLSFAGLAGMIETASRGYRLRICERADGYPDLRDRHGIVPEAPAPIDRQLQATVSDR